MLTAKELNTTHDKTSFILNRRPQNYLVIVFSCTHGCFLPWQEMAEQLPQLTILPSSNQLVSRFPGMHAAADIRLRVAESWSPSSPSATGDTGERGWHPAISVMVLACPQAGTCKQLMVVWRPTAYSLFVPTTYRKLQSAEDASVM